MSRTRRNFSSKFKSNLVLEVLKGEKDLNTIAVENNIQPNLLRNWKKVIPPEEPFYPSIVNSIYLPIALIFLPKMY